VEKDTKMEVPDEAVDVLAVMLLNKATVYGKSVARELGYEGEEAHKKGVSLSHGFFDGHADAVKGILEMLKVGDWENKHPQELIDRVEQLNKIVDAAYLHIGGATGRVN